MPFDIIEGTPLPTWERTKKYNIDELEVGQALIIPAGQKHTSSAIYASARKLGIKVAIRELKADATDGSYKAGDTGVWRTA